MRALEEADGLGEARLGLAVRAGLLLGGEVEDTLAQHPLASAELDRGRLLPPTAESLERSRVRRAQQGQDHAQRQDVTPPEMVGVVQPQHRVVPPQVASALAVSG